MNNYNYGICKETFDFLCTLVRLGMKFECPLEKVIQLRVDNGEVQYINDEVYRRKR